MAYHMIEFTKYSFCGKNDETSAVCGSFSEKARQKLSLNRKKYNNLLIAKDHEQRDSFKCL